MKKIMNIIDEENNLGQYEIFCTFDSKLTNRSYVIYMKKDEADEKFFIMKAGSYVEEEDLLKVDTRLTHQEYEMISNIVKNILKQAEEFNL